MSEADPYQPARLLAKRPGMSRIEHDAIFEHVVARDRPPRRAWWLAAFAVVSVAAAVLVIPRLGGGDDGFTTRGGSTRAGLEVRCVLAGAVARCATGATMAFEVTAPADRPYFAAYARRADGTVIWYLPESATATSHRAPAAGGVVDTGVVLGAEHPAGRYQLEGVFSARPLTRADIRALPDAPGAEVVRVQREVVIQ